MSGRVGDISFRMLFNRTCPSFTQPSDTPRSAVVNVSVTHPEAAIAGVAGAATMPPVTSIATAATQNPGRIAAMSRLITLISLDLPRTLVAGHRTGRTRCDLRAHDVTFGASALAVTWRDRRNRSDAHGGPPRRPRLHLHHLL